MSSAYAIFILFLATLPNKSMAHPMDLGSLSIEADTDRLSLSLKIHTLLATALTGQKVPDDLQSFSDPLLNESLGMSPPVYGGDRCYYRKPNLVYADPERQFLELHVIAVCLGAKVSPFSLHFSLPFLIAAPSTFQLLTHLNFAGETHSFVVHQQKPQIDVGKDVGTFWSFVRMGMGHIGTLTEEWHTSTENLKWPEGLDHILFVLTLVISGGGIGALIKAASGFTIGHSITLALAVFNVIHIHSRWIDACIALSIAYVAGTSLLRRTSSKHWITTALFGAVHGLGFAAALQDLELGRSEALWALLGFNLGVEVGQCLIILMALVVLFTIKKISAGTEDLVQRYVAIGLFIIGCYWFALRAIN